MCTLGDHRMSVLPPSALKRSDAIKKGMWEVRVVRDVMFGDVMFGDVMFKDDHQ